MANVEVSVPAGDVVVVPTEGNEGENTEDTKTQMILQFQTVQKRIYEAGSENSSTVVAAETHTIHKTKEGIDSSSIKTSEDMEIAYPITCGECKAVLLWKKFVCPGINMKCIKFNDQLITPKHFVHLAGKSTLRDWKRAIRLGGIMLRKMMNSGQIDFYQHDKVCSNTCRGMKFDFLISSARAPVPGQQTNVVQTSTSADGNITLIATSKESMEEMGLEWNSAVRATVNMATKESKKKGSEETSEETLMFWKQIADAGLMEEVICNIQKELEGILRGVQQRLIHAPFQVTDAAILNSVTKTFGLMDTVKKVLDNRWKQSRRERNSFSIPWQTWNSNWKSKESKPRSPTEVPDHSKCGSEACEHSKASKKTPAPATSLHHLPESFSCPAASVYCHLSYHHDPRGSVFLHGQYPGGYPHPGPQSCDCPHASFLPSALPLCHSGFLCQEQLTSNHPPFIGFGTAKLHLYAGWEYRGQYGHHGEPCGAGGHRIWPDFSNPGC